MSTTPSAPQLLAQAESAAQAYTDKHGREIGKSFHLGLLTAMVRTLCAEIAELQHDGETQHQRVERLVREAMDIVLPWCDHAVAGDDAGSVHNALSDALGLLADVRFAEADDTDELDHHDARATEAAAINRAAA